MSQILSQEEINTLLNAISHYDEDKTNKEEIRHKQHIRIYDFRRPDKFSRLEIRFMSEFAEKFINTWTSAMAQNSQFVLKEPKISLCSVDQLTWSEYTRCMPEKSITAYYKDWYNGVLSFTCENENIFDKWYDEVKDHDSDKDPRKWKEAQMTLAIWFADYVLLRRIPEYKDKDGRDEDLKDYITHSDNIHPRQDGDMILYIAFSLNDSGSTDFSMAIDSAALRKFFNEYNGITTTDKAIEISDFGNVEVTVEASLGKAKKKINDLVGLKEGAIIELDTLAGMPTEVKVDGKVIAKAEVVICNDNYAVRLTEVL